MSVQAVTNSDEPVIIAVVQLAAVFVVLANILVDLRYAVLDPRTNSSWPWWFLGRMGGWCECGGSW